MKEKVISSTETTRLHSSRMRTARALTVSPSMLCVGGSALGGRVSALGGRVSALGGRVSALGGRVSALGGRVSALGGSAPGGSALGEVCSLGGVVSKHAPSQTPPWTETQTPVKTLPCPNFVAGGKNKKRHSLLAINTKYGVPIRNERGHINHR